MTKEILIELFTRDIKKLKKEIELYTDSSTLWKTSGSINNSGGNLCLHLIGNLKSYIGNGLAHTPYIRDRDFEFNAKNIDTSILLKELDETIIIVTKALSNLNEEALKGDFPVLIWEEKTGMLFTLIHLHSHLNYHRGQINYHRRALER